MPVDTYTNETYRRRPLGGDPIHSELSRLRSYFMPSSYHPRDANGDRLIYQGLVVAEVSGGIPESWMTASQPYYVPWSAAGSYGTGSDTAVGIVREFHDGTLSDWQVTPVDRGIAYEARVYCGGGPIGSVPAVVKTNLSGITWR